MGGGQPRAWKRALEPVGFLPLSVLFGLNLVDELDRVAFAILAPEIRDAFQVSDSTIVAVASLATALSILLALPIGFIADRRTRVGVSIGAAVGWSLGALLTGFARTLQVIGLARFLAGAGRLVGDSIHPSLLSDYYEPRSWATVNAIHRAASPIGGIVGAPIVGFLATHYHWRSVFFLLLIPTFLALVGASRLRDPRSPEQPEQGGLGFRDSFLELSRTPMLRRIWLVAFFYGGAFVPFLTTLLGLYFDQVFGFDAQQRGLVVGLHSLGAVGGLIVGGWLGTRALAQGRPDRIMRLVGLFIVSFGIGLALMAVVPWAAVAIVLAIAIAPGTSGYLPPYSALAALVTSRAVRSQAFSYALLFFALGGLTFSQLVARVIAVGGIRWSYLLLALLATLSGGIALWPFKPDGADSYDPPSI